MEFCIKICIHACSGVSSKTENLDIDFASGEYFMEIELRLDQSYTVIIAN